LWQIRAKRVVHDQQERQIYFDNAQLRILDVPVFYIPHMRLPDPTLKRATGFLIPELRNDSQLGTGVKAPYFIKLGDHRDLTLTPYLSNNTTTLEMRYRQAFRRGTIEFSGAISQDSLTTQNTRGYLFGTGKFQLNRDYVLSFDLKSTSDNAYLLDYDYSDADRLESVVAIERSKRDENTRFALTHYNSLRTTESNATLPTIIGSAETERRFFPKAIGGEGRLQLGAYGHHRTSTLNVDSIDADNVVDGRDVARLNGEVSWRRSWTLMAGLRAGVTTALAFDAIRTEQDATSDTFVSQLTPAVAAHLRWPMVKTSKGGTAYVIEPIAQIGWVGGDTLNIANDESTRVEFDEGNLLSLSRFPSVDRRERGVVGAVGFSWSRIDPSSWGANLTFGQVYRDTNNPDFTDSSGLAGQTSDLLVAGQIKTQSGLTLTARTLFDPTDGLNKAEAHAGWSNTKLALDASYVWLGADAAEDRANTLSEWSLDSSYRMSKHWTGLMNWRFDVAASETVKAGVGLEYRNECVKVNFSVSRRFTSSATVTPSTDIGFTVALLGFSAASSDASYTRQCKNAG
jgi:LPS-assembly protein